MIIKRVTITPGSGWGFTKETGVDGKPGSIWPELIEGWGDLIEGSPIGGGI